MSVVTLATKVMSPSSYSFEHRLGAEGDLNTCTQQANSPYHHANTTSTATAAAHLKSISQSTCSSTFSQDDQDEQAKRNKLIQAATNRLRQKRLEIKLQAMMAQVVEMQCQLDIIKLDTSTSLQLLPSSNMSETQLSHFEKRLAQHRRDLQHVFQYGSKKEDPSSTIEPKETKTSSTISSLLSNILYSKSNKDSHVVMMREEQDSDYSILGGSIHHHQKRRKRRHYQQHGSMQKHVDDTSSLSPLAATTTATSASSSVLSIEKDNDDMSSEYTETTSSVCWSSFDRMSDNNSILVQPLHQEVITNARNRHELLVLHSIHPSAIPAASEISKAAIDRNALDDVLSFLNGSELSTNNDRLVRDIYEILEQEYAFHKPPTATQLNGTFPVLNLLRNMLDKGKKWIKFALVMILAIIINLKKGPKSFL
ncbi:hypothetical protein HMPREF1544_05972 [Mucor circinelloides 1006PhL]|uniref:Uncharacterized protein n=1 Tax=Mucor circinelloides f. circinelloides (strain 1006PhL) TaxID=1220926 RepID=S2K4W5_MUCC1|nr:hypothetical protein HMPREF1544_05972 [Mucor circinelloides 1006PhL]KAG1112799.1 hypothetical protein G6F42_014637 [Rhizopus arrhizus]